MNVVKKIAHIGIAVKNLDPALSFYTEVLGLSVEKITKVKKEGVKIAFIKIGETRFELLEPLYNTSPIQRFIEKKGEGIHHIALEVDDIEGRLNSIKLKGIHLIDDTKKSGVEYSDVAFIHPKSTNGVLFELYQPNKKSDC